MSTCQTPCKVERANHALANEVGAHGGAVEELVAQLGSPMERLEHTYMKHVVDAGAVVEPKMVGDRTNAFNHQERASKLRVELAS